MWAMVSTALTRDSSQTSLSFRTIVVRTSDERYAKIHSDFQREHDNGYHEQNALNT